MKTFIITIKAITEIDNQDIEDRNYFNLDLNETIEYEYKAENEDKALDNFHAIEPIAYLEDFEITIKEK